MSLIIKFFEKIAIPIRVILFKKQLKINGFTSISDQISLREA